MLTDQLPLGVLGSVQHLLRELCSRGTDLTSSGVPGP
jgi:hypothetical protein